MIVLALHGGAGIFKENVEAICSSSIINSTKTNGDDNGIPWMEEKEKVLLRAIMVLSLLIFYK